MEILLKMVGGIPVIFLVIVIIMTLAFYFYGVNYAKNKKQHVLRGVYMFFGAALYLGLCILEVNDIPIIFLAAAFIVSLSYHFLKLKSAKNKKQHALHGVYMFFGAIIFVIACIAIDRI